jgi:hypothetical protein
MVMPLGVRPRTRQASLLSFIWFCYILKYRKDSFELKFHHVLSLSGLFSLLTQKKNQVLFSCLKEKLLYPPKKFEIP